MVKEARSLFDLTEDHRNADTTPAPQPGRREYAAKKTISDLLFNEAIVAGGKDNVTVLLVAMSSEQ